MSEWDWELTDTDKHDFERLDQHARDRITSKLDGIVAEEWREPVGYLEPLAGVPHSKIYIGQFRIGCRADRRAKILYVLRIRKRGGTYRGDD